MKSIIISMLFYFLLLIVKMSNESDDSNNDYPSNYDEKYYSNYYPHRHDQQHDPEWNYKENGPDIWPILFNECSGHKQSPINIQTNKTQYDKTLLPFKFINYYKIINWTIVNNGKTIRIDPNWDQNRTTRFSLGGSNLETKLPFNNFHFHWGYNNYQGSEHRIDSKKYPLEMHIIHKYKVNTYFVLSFLFEIKNTDNVNLNPIVKTLNKVRYTGNKTNITNFSLLSIFPNEKDLKKYYQYEGSLTTPPCTQGIMFSIFKSNINISHKQVITLKNVQNFEFK
jgi:carbonic anhydrase